MNIYYPSCNFNIASPHIAKKIREYVKNHNMSTTICCRFDKTDLSDEDTAFIICQACRKVIQPKAHHIKTLYEFILDDPHFIYPNYHGEPMNLQDCYRDKDHPEVHDAIRELLKRMNISIIEIKQNKEKANFCGTLHYESDLLKHYPETKLSHLPEDIQKQVMAEHVNQYNCEKVVCYCNRCLKGITLGGGHGFHILDLLFSHENNK